jgi:hypothetical protein
MARREIDVLLDRAKGGSREVPSQSMREKRSTFSGDPQAGSPGYAVRSNRKAARRKVSTFNLILWLFGIGIGIVLYVDNTVVIKRLALEINKLEEKQRAILNVNAALQAEVTRKAAWERIGKNATEQLGLAFPTEQPTLFNMDQEKVERVKSE